VGSRLFSWLSCIYLKHCEYLHTTSLKIPQKWHMFYELKDCKSENNQFLTMNIVYILYIYMHNTPSKFQSIWTSNFLVMIICGKQNHKIISFEKNRKITFYTENFLFKLLKLIKNHLAYKIYLFPYLKQWFFSF
jgi:hypothetical protein